MIRFVYYILIKIPYVIKLEYRLQLKSNFDFNHKTI